MTLPDLVAQARMELQGAITKVQKLENDLELAQKVKEEALEEASRLQRLFDLPSADRVVASLKIHFGRSTNFPDMSEEDAAMHAKSLLRLPEGAEIIQQQAKSLGGDDHWVAEVEIYYVAPAPKPEEPPVRY